MNRKAVRAIIIKDNKLLVMHRNKFGHQYYTLVGGGIKSGETPQHTLVREIREETSLHATHARHVFTEEAGDPYGTQYIFLCAVADNDGTVKLLPTADEAHINALGKNLHTPMWLPLQDLPNVPFRSERLKEKILHGLKNGFPDTPQTV
jgi:ADP-ribose pyrophosphatase YjhB (NUDIX family)